MDATQGQGQRVEAAGGGEMNEKSSKPRLKLFVWYNVRPDYTSGIAFALAHTVEQARKQIKKHSEDWEWNSYKGEIADAPTVYTRPFGFWMSGGG